jgi:hypothetical protein
MYNFTLITIEIRILVYKKLPLIYGLDRWKIGFRLPTGAHIFFTTYPDRAWGPPSLLLKGQGPLPWRKAVSVPLAIIKS